ncbi:nose resistant to fluoxetine protein 6-like [Acanthaster planci]|uniref:Nose resistant to fluoxetine protein 6-like n=1 Tax=Acanthaster planci TaxID=133434 RepID=A0A8B7ZHS0_ACAPL|nr:nose resistant to fluoxetine protein 6-like [Acanthaster planci]
MVVVGTLYHLISHRRIQANITKTKAKIEKMEEALSGEKTKKSMKEKEIERRASVNGNIDWPGMNRFSGNHHTTHDNDGFLDVEGALEATENTVPSTDAPVYCTCGVKANKKKVKKMGFLDTLLMGFSALHNGAKIMNTKEAAGNLGVLNGIRVISMWWIILGHTIYFMTPFLDDPRYAGTELYSSFWFSAILYSTVSVDTFFFLSGLLLVYLTLKQLEKSNGKLNWFLFYLHRFVRITPAYMISIAIWTTLTVYFGQGPGKITLFETAAGNCRERWWTNLLYINNLYPFPGSLSQQCMGWTWYLANDMQFFVISPVIIYLLYKPYNNNTVVVYENTAADIIYSKPYCRIPAYLVGMVFGYIFYKLNRQTFKMNKWVNTIMWILAIGVGLSIVYGPYRDEGEPLPQYAAVMYTTLSRAGFVMAVGWVAFSCVVGYGGPVNSLLSWSFWAPLSRITFGAYLLHPILIYAFYTSAKSQYHFTYIMLASTFIANMVLSYAAAFILSIGVEGPVMGLEKALLGGRARGKKN